MGFVFDIQRFCLHDGPGLRTTVFLKGCPLACRWCSNPESQRFEPEIFYNAVRCLHCGACVAACPTGAICLETGAVRIDRRRCDACGNCEAVCPTASLIRKGRNMTAVEVVETVAKDRKFYETSGGGATISGGEPFGQPEFLHELLTALKAAGISVAVESSVQAEWRDIEHCLPLLDHLLIDIKHTDSARHEEWTGVSLEKIRPNLERLLAEHPGAALRIPVIPGFNTDAEAFEGFAEFIAETGTRAVELLPYHILGEGKYGMLDRGYPASEVKAADAFAETVRLTEFLRGRGVEVTING